MLGFDQHLVAGRNRPSGLSLELEIEERQLERGCWTHGDLESYSRCAETQEAAGPESCAPVAIRHRSTCAQTENLLAVQSATSRASTRQSILPRARELSSFA